VSRTALRRHRSGDRLLTAARGSGSAPAPGVAAPFSPTGDAPGRGYRGQIDTVDQGFVTGWSLAPDNPSESIPVTIQIDDSVVTVALAEEPRGDLRDIGLDAVNHGFRVAVPSRYHDARRHELRVLGPDGTDCVDNSPWLVVFGSEAASAYRSVANVLASGWNRRSRRVLLVGSAPTLADHLDRLASYDGEVWALNDAAFWCEDNGISLSRVIIADQRFLKKRSHELNRLRCRRIMIKDNLRLTQGQMPEAEVYGVECRGRDGFSDEPGRAFHGCSVAMFAAQCAVSEGFSRVDFAGVLLHPPRKYARIDGSRSLPEYVYPVQLNNARLAAENMRARGVSFGALEPDSSINFL
jgi:hypothetical protein